MRPDSIDVQLTQDGDVVATAVLDDDTNWQADFTGLDKFADDGATEYEYKSMKLMCPAINQKLHLPHRLTEKRNYL